MSEENCTSKSSKYNWEKYNDRTKWDENDYLNEFKRHFVHKNLSEVENKYEIRVK